MARSRIAVLLLLLVVGPIVLGPMAWTADPLAQNPAVRLQGPSATSPLGTDQFGRDMLSRVLRGGRISLGISLIVTLINATTGIALGSLSATKLGLVDALLMRVVSVLLAFPFLLLAMAVAGLAGGGMGGVVLAMALFGWGTYARVARTETLRVRSLPFVEAAHSLGASPLWVCLRHVLPNAMPALIVLALIRFAQTILTVAGLSFLGVGIQPPTPEWGAMLNEGLPFLERAPHMMLVPGIASTLSCAAVSLAGESLRREWDPRSREIAGG